MSTAESQKDLYSNDEPVVILHVANGVTEGDSMVWFRKSDVVVTGEIFNQASFPLHRSGHTAAASTAFSAD